MSSSVFRQAVCRISRSRTFTSSSVSRKDLVQDLYLKELRSYKPAPVPKDAHVGVVKKYSQPTAPKAPILPSDLASELSAYDAAEPVLATKTNTVAESQDIGTGAEAYLSFLEQDPPKAEVHH